MKRNLFLTIIIPILFSCQNKPQKTGDETTNSQPNIVYILADDLGYGDLGCYGQSRFQTPNLDKMASEGMLFTQHYAGTTVCAPSRSSLMTGQHTGHTPIRGNKEVQPEGQWPIPDGTFTIAEMLKQAGYVTGGFGKWGLGYPGSEGEPNNQGFDEFFGYNCQRLAHNYYPSHLWDNQTKIILEGNRGDKFEDYAAELIHEKALQFIEKNKNKPFFLFYPNVIPHAELLLPEENLAEFRGQFLPEKEFKGAEPGDDDFRNGAYGTQAESHAAFAAMVTLLDQQVGEVLAKLKELGLENNTIVMFSSDNGPHLEGGADPDYFDSNGPLQGYKRDLYEGGIREPMIAWWPGKIEAGTKSGHISAFWDVMPTVADIAEIEVPGNIDGISFLPTLLNQGEQKEHDYLYWEFHEKGGRKAIRKGDWKLVRYDVLHPEKTTTELYDLSTDIGEEHNVADEHPEIVKELLELIKSARTESEVFTFK
ncbi:sulfatase-like hydrolase/transferase [Maribellus comscasis]|uniref:Sulfatase-like hydrolase/transferase n=1 Tax=Maribellus comscasis TaxID=2681766 RepID=A0A6I6JYU0_9BACT|nr:arylsulfatase [Maribellus comscasis]QGY44303.1 sulfatase-like hydrolase/transferase [Maribellus comscasis]